MRLGKRISEDPYLLPDPEILREDPDARLSIPPSEGVKGASSPRPESLPVLTDPTQQVDVFQDKKLMISEDLEIGSRLRKVLEDIVVGSGGTITTSVHNADMYICHWRSGRDYAIASHAGKDVGNLSWLYHLITYNQWTSPMKRLLHYPLPKYGIEGFKGFRITLSNYGGDARVYLENLIVACGAEMTKSMKDDNTHVITARKTGEKVDAAAEWGIEVVNHIWLEESYARCEMQRISDPRYTHFPPRTNLGEVVGQTPLDLETLREIYFPKEPTPSPNKPGPLKRPGKGPAAVLPEETTKDGEDEEEIPQEPTAPPKKPLSRSKSKSKATSLPKEGATTPLPNRRTSAGKENNTPSSTGSRSAKDRALNNLQGMAPDIALYEKEKKRKGSKVWGGERAATKIDKEKSDERQSSPLSKEPQGDYSGEENSKPKRQKTGLPPVAMRLLVTKYEPWVGHASVEEKDKVSITVVCCNRHANQLQKKMRELGVLVVQDAKQCSHLAAPKLVRTKKFLCALAHGPTILDSSFIEACGKSSVIPDVETHVLKDPENEKKFDVKLRDAVVRAKANNRSLLRNVPVYCTAKIPNGPDTYKAITEANGGIFSIYTGKNAMKKVAPEDDPQGPEPVYLVSGIQADELKLWKGFKAMAKSANMIPRIVATAWILDVCMSQQLKWNEKEYPEPGQGST